MGKNTRRVACALVAVAVVGVTVLVVFGKPRLEKDVVPGNPWRDAIYDFQTLLTGFAAVAAAAATIIAMEKTDRASERRHRELVEIQLQPDLRRLERALNPQIGDLRGHLLKLSDFRNIETRIEPGPGLDWRWMVEFGNSHLPSLTNLDLVLTRPQFEDGINLFDGITTRFLQELTKLNAEVIGQVTRHMEMDLNDDFNDPARAAYDEDFDDAFEHLKSNVGMTVECLRRLVERLERIETKYSSEFNRTLASDSYTAR